MEQLGLCLRKLAVISHLTRRTSLFPARTRYHTQLVRLRRSELDGDDCDPTPLGDNELEGMVEMSSVEVSR
jgi:hypothetical protein